MTNPDMTHPEPNGTPPTPSDRETLAQLLQDAFTEATDNATRENRFPTTPFDWRLMADGVLSRMQEQGFSHPRPWRESEKVGEARGYLLRKSLVSEGQSAVAFMDDILDALDALCDVVAACGAGSEDTADLDWLEAQYGLHAGLDILYVVDGYTVTPTRQDGDVVGTTHHGTTLREAIRAARTAPAPQKSK